MGSSFLASGGVVSPPKGPKPLACRPAVPTSPTSPAVSALKPHLPTGHKNTPAPKSFRRLRQPDEAAEGFDTCMRRGSEAAETLCGTGLEDLSTAVDSWDFRYSGPANSMLCDVGLAVFAKYTFWDDFGLTTEMVKAFFAEVAEAYPSNPYHSQEHAADVLQSTHVLLMSHGSLRGFLTDVDLFTLMVSAVCHDLHHPGVDSTTVKALEPAFARVCWEKEVLHTWHTCSSSVRTCTPPPPCFTEVRWRCYFGACAHGPVVARCDSSLRTFVRLHDARGGMERRRALPRSFPPLPFLPP